MGLKVLIPLLQCESDFERKARKRTSLACLTLMYECLSKMKRSFSPVELPDLEKTLVIDWQVFPARL